VARASRDGQLTMAGEDAINQWWVGWDVRWDGEMVV